MPSKNPTKTGNIERRWNSEINKRWTRFKKSTVTRLKGVNKALITNAEPFALSPQLISDYMAFYRSEIEAILLGSPEAPNWQSRYQLQSYMRGYERARDALEMQGAIPSAQVGDIPLSLQVSQLPQAHKSGLEFLYTRLYESLNGWTDSLARETRQILTDSFEQGLGINETVRSMVERQGVSKSRARVIARTETIQAYQRAGTTEAKRLEEDTGAEITMRWITAMDSRVRHLHASWHGTTVTPQENSERINRSPWNCRCAQVPVIVEVDTAKKRQKFAEERKRLLMLERR